MVKPGAEIARASSGHSSLEATLTLILAWLVPGAGFMAHGRLWRGLTLFVALGLTFALGIVMHGGVVWPVWSPSDPSSGFNIVNNFTFIIQLGDGLPSLLSLCAARQGTHGWLSALAADPKHPFFDLSSFYLLVAGAMNYFVVCNTYDRLFAPPTDAQSRPDREERP